MSIVTKPFYKYCIVPNCTNTNRVAPKKLFFVVPKDPIKRKRWCVAMKRDMGKGNKLSWKSSLYCCEDHFSLQDDMQNYWQYQLTNNVKQLKLKPDVVPHRFECQPRKKPSKERKYVAKKRRGELIEQCLQQEDSPNIEDNVEEMSVDSEGLDKNIQVCIKPLHRSKYVNATVGITTTGTSPIKHGVKDAGVQTSLAEKQIILDQKEAGDSSGSDYQTEPERASSEDYSDEEEAENLRFQEHLLKATYMRINKFPKMHIGLPEESAFIIHCLVSVSRIPLRNIYIVLKKIQLNESFDILGVDFGMSKSNVSRIFSRSLPQIASLMENLIVWPTSEEVHTHLPIPFRARYSKVVSIIDCREILIEKPSDTVHQSLTWSSYKKGNTLKYLISCTPDGLTNFISCGYGGRASDTAIFEDCGFVKKLTPGNAIMADRGFKHIASTLELQGCKLIRPPSVEASVPSSRLEVKQSKQIAALRIHVERVIGRLREFKMLLPHCCLDIKMVPLTDYIIKIACGIINMQSEILKS